MRWNGLREKQIVVATKIELERPITRSNFCPVVQPSWKQTCRLHVAIWLYNRSCTIKLQRVNGPLGQK